MTGKLRLKLIACHRGESAVAVEQRVRSKHSARNDRIRSGPLRGCWRASASAGGTKVNVFKFGDGYVLELRPAIRL